jgi:Terminase large subunit, T4likevirus-type, N-terminal
MLAAFSWGCRGKLPAALFIVVAMFAINWAFQFRLPTGCDFASHNDLWISFCHLSCLDCLACADFVGFWLAGIEHLLWYRLGMRWDTYDEIPLPGPSRLKAGSGLAGDGVPDAAAFARTRLGFVPDARQLTVLQSTAKRGILNCSRQWGKSTVAAAKAVHLAYTRPGSVVLVASPSERQSGEFIRKAAGMVRRLGIRSRGDGDNAISLALPNRSRIVGLPGTDATIRGFSAVSMVLIDEAARVSDDMYMALRPMLAVGDGDLWIMSTPCGQRGFFYDAWRDEGGDWMRVSVPATECSRIPATFLEKERRDMPSAVFSQEYMCEFTGDGTEYFDQLLIEDALDEGIPEMRIPGPGRGT